MKKIISILLALLMVFALAACGDKPAPGTDNPVAPSGPDAQEKDMATLSTEAYEAFLKGDLAATVKNDFDVFKAGQSFHLNGLVEKYVEGFNDEYSSVDDYDLKYAYIDCGKDGIPELLLEQELFGDWDGMIMKYIFKFDGEKLNLIKGFDGYYRYWTEINNYGYVFTGGSSGAAYFDADYYLINADGEIVFLYSYGCDNSQSTPNVPYYHLDETKLPEDYIDNTYNYDVEKFYTCEHYNFADYKSMVPDWDDEDYDEKYAEYCKNYFYTFFDEYGEEAEVSPEYAKLYKQLGVKIVSNAEAQKMVDDHLKECGLTDELKAEEYPEMKILGEEESVCIVNDDGSVTVNTVQGLVDALDDGKTIYLKPGTYNLTKWLVRHRYDYYDSYVNCREYDWANCVAKKVFATDQQFIVSRANSVTIASEDPANPAEIIIDSPYCYVMSFCECSGITIKDIVAGHSKGNEGSCSADVFEFNSCDNVTVEGCDLYGCGAYGFYLVDSANITMNGGCIHDCTYGCVESYDATPVYFNDVEFRDCADGYTMFCNYRGNMHFKNCSFSNLNDMFSVEDGFVSLTGCTFDDAAMESLESNEDFGSLIVIYED